MIEINIYQAKKFDFKIEFPSTWNELRQDEIIYISKTLLNETDAASVKAFILKFIMEKRTASFRRGLPEDWFAQIDSEQLVIDCYPLLDFIFKENNLTKDPEPITHFNKTYHPQPFKKITCGEYEDAETKANLFAQNPSADLLASLAAILFRPLLPPDKKKGRPAEVEPYQKFDQATNSYYTYNVEQKLKYFKKLPPEQLYAIFIWYAGNRAELAVMFPNVFSGGEEEGEKDITAFTKCIHSGAGPKNGTRLQIRGTELFEFMFDMDEEARKAKELEEEYERMKRK